MPRTAQPLKPVDISPSSEPASSKGRFRSPLRYPGGKQRAIEQISQHFPESAIEYREPFVGGGSVYFYAKTNTFAQKYWINDKFKELVSFWNAVKDPIVCSKLQKELEELRTSFRTPKQIKDYFLKVREEQPESEYREAFLFFFFNRVTFSGTTRAGGFSKAASLRRFTASSVERLAPMPNALAQTKITNLDFEEVIRIPGEDVFLFLDPPYFKATKLYGQGGSLHSFDHERLANCLNETSKQSRFLITYDDCPEIRKIYKWANIKEWSLQYGMNNCNLQHESKIGKELFISNY